MYHFLKKILLLLWKDDDRMEQQTLFDLQILVGKEIYEVAKKEKMTDDLCISFPWLFKKEV